MTLSIDTQEVQRIINEASQNNWIPIGIVCFLTGVIIFLFIYILKIYQKNNDKRHEQSEELLSKMVESNSQLTKMVAVHESEIRNLKQTA